ncbi:MAG: hypothetical protein KUF72_16095, partial [Candidatus Thiodiazotropha sp. (ex Ctena orbiculata)]|nr:hypothetical protein [Candidatus Thiodiazotropha taylori]
MAELFGLDYWKIGVHWRLFRAAFFFNALSAIKKGFEGLLGLGVGWRSGLIRCAHPFGAPTFYCGV